MMVWNETAPFPDDTQKLGRYIQPSIDIGPAMMAKIISASSQVLCMLTDHALIQVELDSSDHQIVWGAFKESLH